MNIQRMGLTKIEAWINHRWIDMLLKSVNQTINQTNHFNEDLPISAEANISLVWFYGTSNIAGYLIPNPLYTYTLNI